jgi:hypothetical protein
MVKERAVTGSHSWKGACPPMIKRMQVTQVTDVRTGAALSAQRTWLWRWAAPSIPELFAFAIVVWVLAFTITGDQTGVGLLHDSQTGYHIRIGEYVLENHHAPKFEFLSFTMQGQPFVAWEWLSGVAAALLFHWDGLRAIVVTSALIIGLTILIMMRHMVWRGANILITLLLAHIAVAASSMHFLARPHILTLLFFAISFWIIDRDWSRPRRALWLLVPITVLWVNLHGGFFGLLVSTGVLAGGSVAEALLVRAQAEAAWKRARRYGLLTLACAAASLLNPYGILEHMHLVRFMSETWYLKLTEEFQPPRFTGATGAYHLILLVIGVLAAARLLWRKQIALALLPLAWAGASLRSVRHITIFAIIALPLIAGELADLWRQWIESAPARTVRAVLNKLARDYQPALTRTSLFPPAAAIALLAFSFGLDYPRDFPEALYPVSMVNRHESELARGRVFTTDSWGHYLSFRFPPPFRIFMDARSDFFGERLTRQYMAALDGEQGWDRLLTLFRVDTVLVPPDSGLARRLRQDSNWRLVDENGSALLFAAAHKPSVNAVLEGIGPAEQF